jgi:hypothetical protein
MNVRLYVLALAAASAAAAEPACRTPPGDPCYSIETKRIQRVFFRDGWWDLGTYTTLEKRAQASDGSFAVITEYAGTSLSGRDRRQERMFYDAVSGQRYWLAPVKKTYTSDKPHIAPAPVPPARRNRSDCEPLPMTRGERYSRAGEETILGFATVHWRSDLPRGGSVDIWAAPALGCARLRSKRVEYGSLRTPVLIDTTEVLRVEAGEPHRSFFTIPAGYKPDDDPRHFRYGTRR